MKKSALVRAALPGALLALAGVGCDGGSTARAAAPPAGVAAPADTRIAARVAGDVITLRDLDAEIAGQLAALEQQIYDLRRSRLTQLVEQRLFEAEAKARGIDADTLIEQEIEAKIPVVSEADMSALFEQHRARLGGRTLEDMRPQLHLAVKERHRGERRKAFADLLAKRADVQLLLEPPRSEVALPADAPSLGESGAPITIVAYSDYQCPYCHRAQSTVEEILRRYQGRVRLVHQDFPLNIHPGAIPAARAARCAGEQQRFWDFHRGLLSQLTDFNEADLKRRASDLKLEPEAFASCLASTRYDAVIDAAFVQGQQLGVQATPTFFINGRRLEGAQPIERFVEVIDEELARKAS